MKPFKRFFALLLSILIVILCFSGCGGSKSNAVIYFEATVTANTLDPQIASNDTELLMIRNLFEGLMRLDSNGEVVPAIAKDYSLHNNTYTFKLSDTSVWSDGEPVTAYDFAFALKRAVDPETRSPYAGKLRNILNAELIMAGQLEPEYLGVNATDATTLTITLKENDSEFLYKLTTSVCMPCREDYFNECKGQYGLSKSHIITNGSYKLTKWNQEDFAVRLHRSDNYYGKFTADNSAVFISYNPETDNIEKLEKSSVDIAYISMSDIDKVTGLGFKTAQYQNVLWVMEMNDVYSYDLRRSLYLTFDRSNYAGDLSVGYNVAYSLFPDTIADINLDYVGIEDYDINEARTLYNTAIAKYPGSRLPSTKLFYYNDPDMVLPINNLVGHWQKQLGAYINTKPYESMNELKKAFDSKECAIIVYPISITDRDPSVLAYQLGYDFSKTNVKILSEVQKKILSERKFMPVAFENTIAAYSNNINDFNFTIGNGLIDFAYVTKN